jgi:hypothetical protein
VVEGAFRTQQEESARGATVSFALETVALALCPLHVSSDVAGARACAGMDAGVLSTHGPGAGTVVERRRFVTDAVVRLEGSLNLGRHLFLAVSPALVVPFVRDTFDYDWNGEQSRVFRMAPVAFTGDLTVGFRTP